MLGSVPRPAYAAPQRATSATPAVRHAARGIRSSPVRAPVVVASSAKLSQTIEAGEPPRVAFGVFVGARQAVANALIRFAPRLFDVQVAHPVFAYALLTVHIVLFAFLGKLLGLSVVRRRPPFFELLLTPLTSLWCPSWPPPSPACAWTRL